MKNFRPMKPADLKGDLSPIKYPILVTPKLDGIRFISVANRDKIELLSNSLKPVRNALIQRIANQYFEPGWDGEILLADHNYNFLPFNEISSVVMSESKEPPKGTRFYFCVFDSFSEPSIPYLERLKILQSSIVPLSKSVESNDFSLTPIKATMATNEAKLLELHQANIEAHYEGSILRSPQSPYKTHGRSTLREGYSLKLKPFMDTEAVVVGFEPFYENTSESFENERGLKEKSKKLADLKPLPKLGSLVVDSPEFGRFNIGTGFNEATRKQIWDDQENIKGSMVKFKYLGIGTKDKPRHPVFLGFRHIEDL